MTREELDKAWDDLDAKYADQIEGLGNFVKFSIFALIIGFLAILAMAAMYGYTVN